MRPTTDLPPGANAWAADPPWDWTAVPAADGVAFETTPFTTDTTFVGPATLDLWIESPTAVEDYQVTVTEVRPAASQEEYVTSGFLRSSNQVDLADSTRLFTDPSYLASEAGTLSPQFVHARQDSGRSDCPHLPGWNPVAHRDLGTRWRPAVVGVRHPRQRSINDRRNRRDRRLDIGCQSGPRCPGHCHVADVRLPARRAVPSLLSRRVPSCGRVPRRSSVHRLSRDAATTPWARP